MVIKPDISTGTARYLLTKCDSALNTVKLAISLDTANNIKVEGNLNSMIEGTAAASQTKTLGAYPNDKFWHILTVTFDLTMSTDPSTWEVKSYVDGTLVGSAQTFSDRYFKDDATHAFMFGSSCGSGARTTSYLGNLYDLKVYNYIRLVPNGDKLTTSGCGNCPQCFPASPAALCLSTCTFDQYFDTSNASCGQCNSCTNGCIRSTDCVVH
jgi:hypothetical protein